MVFIRRTDVQAEIPILWPPDVKSWLNGKDPDAGKEWGQKEKGTTEDEMVIWHHQLNGHGFVWTPGFGDGQGGLAYCSSWSRKESDTTEWLNWTDFIENSFMIRTECPKKETKQWADFLLFSLLYLGMGLHFILTWMYIFFSLYQLIDHLLFFFLLFIFIYFF